MFTATLTVPDLDFLKPKDAAVALLAAAGEARPLSVVLYNQHTGEEHLVEVTDRPATENAVTIAKPQAMGKTERMLDLLHRNLEAWEDEEESVKEEHEELITDLRNFLESK